MRFTQAGLNVIYAISTAHSRGHLNPTAGEIVQNAFPDDKVDIEVVKGYLDNTLSFMVTATSNGGYRLRDEGYIARVQGLPWCNLCTNVKVEARFDCYVPGYGTWGNVCLSCFNYFDANIGLGRGQILVPTAY